MFYYMAPKTLIKPVIKLNDITIEIVEHSLLKKVTKYNWKN